MNLYKNVPILTKMSQNAILILILVQLGGSMDYEKEKCHKFNKVLCGKK